MPPPHGLANGRPPLALILLSVIILGLGIAAFVVVQQRHQQAMQRLQHDLMRSQEELAQRTAQTEELSEQLKSLRAERKGLEERVSALRTQLSTAATNLEQARSELQDLRERYDRFSEERSRMEATLASAAGERDETKQRAQRLETDNAELQRSVGRLRERLALLDRDYRQLAEKLAAADSASTPPFAVASTDGQPVAPHGSTAPLANPPSSPGGTGAVELPPIIIRKDQGGVSMPVRGRVVEVNDVHNFIVVDKGSMDGVRVGAVLDILRGAGSVGRATVVRVRPKLSACDIIRAQTPERLQVGDLAVQSGS